MNDDELMYVLEAIAYISASVAAFVYVWETCSPIRRLKYKRNNSNSSIHEDKLITKNRRSSSSLYEDF